MRLVQSERCAMSFSMATLGECMWFWVLTIAASVSFGALATLMSFWADENRAGNAYGGYVRPQVTAVEHLPEGLDYG